MRELSHVALGKCGQRVGRGLAPHVRSLIGPLITGACDPYPPSGAAAREAFGVSFPPGKEVEVIRYGLKAIVKVRESLYIFVYSCISLYISVYSCIFLYSYSFLLQYCSDIILKESPDTFSDPK